MNRDFSWYSNSETLEILLKFQNATKKFKTTFTCYYKSVYIIFAEHGVFINFNLLKKILYLINTENQSLVKSSGPVYYY